MNSNIIEKIKKLLSLANSENQNERDLALAKAGALAAEHKIDMALVNLSDVGVIKEEEMVNEELEVRGRALRVEFKLLAWLLQEHFSVDIVWNRRRMNGTIEVSFIGRTSDVLLAKWLHEYLLGEMKRRWNEARLEHGYALSSRNSFLYGMYLGMNGKLHDERRALEAQKFGQPERYEAETPAEAAPSPKQVYTLALKNEKEKRKDAIAKFHGRIRNVRSTVSRRDSGAVERGSAAGRSVSFNRQIAA